MICKLRDPADSAGWGKFVTLHGLMICRLARGDGPQDADAHDKNLVEKCRENRTEIVAGRLEQIARVGQGLGF